MAMGAPRKLKQPRPLVVKVEQELYDRMVAAARDHGVVHSEAFRAILLLGVAEYEAAGRRALRARLERHLLTARADPVVAGYLKAYEAGKLPTLDKLMDKLDESQMVILQQAIRASRGS